MEGISAPVERPGHRDPRPAGVWQHGGQRGEQLGGACRDRRVPVRDDAGPLGRDVRGRPDGDAVPGRAESLAQRGELTGERVPGGDRPDVGEHGDDLAWVGALGWSGGVAGGQDAFGFQREQVIGGRDRRGLGRRRRGRAAGRGGVEGKPEETGPVAGQVQPPGAARRHGGKLDDAPPGSRLALAGLERNRVASPLVVHRPEPVVRQVLRPGPGDLQVRARTVRGPVHAHDHGDQGLGPGRDQGHEVHRGRRMLAGHLERPPDGRDPHVRVGRARGRRLEDSRREYGAVQHAPAAIPVQQEP